MTTGETEMLSNDGYSGLDFDPMTNRRMRLETLSQRALSLCSIVLAAVCLTVLGCGLPSEESTAQSTATETPAAADSVSSALDRLPSDATGELLRQALDAAGLEAWEAKKSVRYLKVATTYDARGQVTGTQEALHTYRLSPTLGVRIESTEAESGKQVLLLNDGEQAWKLVGGVEDTSTAGRNQAYNSTYGSHYVFAQPFKLLDPGSHYQDAGERTLANGKVAHGVRVTYDEGAGSAGGKHTWTYWFGEDDHLLAANHLVYGDGDGDADMTEYDALQSIDGVTLATARSGFKANRSGQRLEHTTSYENRDITFDVEVTPEMFHPPL